MSSELELLRQRVTKLEAENIGLKQIIEEIANLRIENTRLNQIKTTNDSLQIPIPPPINDHSDEADSVNLEQTQIAISPEKSLSNSISDKQIPENMLDRDNLDAKTSSLCETPGSASHLAHLFDKAKKTGQKEILRWYYYSEEFEKK
ncbi:540_t:CDS:2, partial [Entrophospora sp. SA101]